MGDKKKSIALTFEGGLTGFAEANSSFDRATLQIAYAGENPNGTVIAKEVFEAAISSLYNVPVVTHYDRATDTIGYHDIALVENADGEIELVNLTQPVGVIPESAEVSWKEVEEPSGEKREYFCVDALIWKRQEAYKKLKTDGKEYLSMEIKIIDGEDMESGRFQIDKFEFTAIALIGSNPCFESASLTFTLNDAKNAIREMLSDYAKETANAELTALRAEVAELRTFKANAEGSDGAALAELNKELKELREYKEKSESEARERERDAVLAEFPDLEGDESFEKLRSDTASNADAIREACYAIRGRRVSVYSSARPKVKPMKPTGGKPYGGLMEHFGFEPKE